MEDKPIDVIPEGHDEESIKLCNKHCKHDHEEPVSSQTVEEEPTKEEHKASDYIQGNTRQENELYCDYKCRLFWENTLMKRYLQGRSVWESRERGEARNMDRRNRVSKNRVKKDRYNDRVRGIQESQGKRTADEVVSRNRETKRFFMEACKK